MRADLSTYYNTLRKQLVTNAEVVTVKLDKVNVKLFVKCVPKLAEHVDAQLYPCLQSRTAQFYLASDYDVQKNNFGKTSNETIIKLTKTNNIVIVRT
jgi:hypothetical protein